MELFIYPLFLIILSHLFFSGTIIFELVDIIAATIDHVEKNVTGIYIRYYIIQISVLPLYVLHSQLVKISL